MTVIRLKNATGDDIADAHEWVDDEGHTLVFAGQAADTYVIVYKPKPKRVQRETR